MKHCSKRILSLLLALVLLLSLSPAASLKAFAEDAEEPGEGVIIACGMSDYDAENDLSVAAVFERADALMYENKKMLKGAR